MDRTITDLLNSGKSPEDILKLAQEEQEKLRATRAEDKKREGARMELIKALNEYVYAVTETYMEVEDVERLNYELEKVETLASAYKKRTGSMKGFSEVLF